MASSSSASRFASAMSGFLDAPDRRHAGLEADVQMPRTCRRERPQYGQRLFEPARLEQSLRLRDLGRGRLAGQRWWRWRLLAGTPCRRGEEQEAEAASTRRRGPIAIAYYFLNVAEGKEKEGGKTLPPSSLNSSSGSKVSGSHRRNPVPVTWSTSCDAPNPPAAEFRPLKLALNSPTTAPRDPGSGGECRLRCPASMERSPVARCSTASGPNNPISRGVHGAGPFKFTAQVFGHHARPQLPLNSVPCRRCQVGRDGADAGPTLLVASNLPLKISESARH